MSYYSGYGRRCTSLQASGGTRQIGGVVGGPMMGLQGEQIKPGTGLVTGGLLPAILP